MPSLNNSRERGVSVMIFTLVSVLVVIPLMGLAIDGSIGFWVKAKLSAALDAAALAARKLVKQLAALERREAVPAG